MNILCFSRSLPCHSIGGMQRVAWDLATGLADRGHQVSVVTTATADGRQTDIPPRLLDRLSVEHLPRTRPARYSRSWWRESRAAYRRRQGLGLGPDVVLSVSASAWAVLPLLGTVPAVLQAHGTSIAEIRSKLRTGRLAAVLEAARNLCWIPSDLRIYRRCQRVVAVGPMAYAALRHPLIRPALPEDKLVMIPNGIDTERFRPDPAARTAMRRRLGIPPDAKVLLWASRLHRQKGTHIALSAFAELAACDLRFVIVGDGPERGHLERQAQALAIADRVHFLGPIGNEDMPHALSVGDAFVFTSIREEVGVTLSILEAMAMDLPLIVSKHLIESFEHVSGVYAVDPSDVAAVSQAMRHAVFSTSCGRAVVGRRYSRKVMVEGYESLFQGLLAARSA